MVDYLFGVILSRLKSDGVSKDLQKQLNICKHQSKESQGLCNPDYILLDDQ